MASLCPESPTARHCDCQGARIQHAVMGHADVRCCWCGRERCAATVREQIEAYGPFRTREIVKREEAG